MSGGDRAEFLDIWQQHVTRPGSEKLLDWLDKKTDFFTAPASTRFHGACEGGLCMHSLNVYHALHDSFFTEGESEESYAICALLHDLCKANYYKLGTRNVKNEATGQWEKAPFYSVDDLFPYGHGEKSVFLIERFMKLKVEEAVAIRWHMGGFDDAARGGCFAISEAYDKYPLAACLFVEIFSSLLRRRGLSPSARRQLQGCRWAGRARRRYSFHSGSPGSAPGWRCSGTLPWPWQG